MVKKNDDISYFYIAYQALLMVSTVIGPGSIVLMLVGAFSLAFGLSNVNSLIFNVVLVGIFVLACLFLKSDMQIMMAQILTLLYAVIMIAVYIGVFIQIGEDGPLSISALGVWFTFGSFIIAAFLHPQVNLLKKDFCWIFFSGVLVSSLHGRVPLHHPIHVSICALKYLAHILQVPPSGNLRPFQLERRIMGDPGGAQVCRGYCC